MIRPHAYQRPLREAQTRGNAVLTGFDRATYPGLHPPKRAAFVTNGHHNGHHEIRTETLRAQLRRVTGADRRPSLVGNPYPCPESPIA